MSNINLLVLESFDVPIEMQQAIDLNTPIASSIAGNLGSGVGSLYSIRHIKDPKQRRKAFLLSKAAGFGGSVLGAGLSTLADSPNAFIAGAGLGGLVGSLAGRSLWNKIQSKKNRRLNELR